MSPIWSLKMGHINIDVQVYSPGFETDISDLIQSLSFGIPSIPCEKKAFIVFVSPDAPDWFVNSLELPEWGKPLSISFFRMIKKINHSSRAYWSKISDLLEIFDLGLSDWFAPNMKAFYFQQNDQLISFVLLLDLDANRDRFIKKITGYIYLLATYWYASHRGLLLHSAAVSSNQYLRQLA